MVHGRNADQNQLSQHVWYPAKVKSYLAKVQHQNRKMVSKLVFINNDDQQNKVLVYVTPYAVHKFQSPDKGTSNGLEQSSAGTTNDYSLRDKITAQLSGLNQFLPQYRGALQVDYANYNTMKDNNNVKG